MPLPKSTTPLHISCISGCSMMQSLPSWSGSVTSFIKSLCGMPNWCQRSQSLQRKSEVRISDFKTSEKLWPDFGLLLFGLWYLPHSTQESAHATPSPEHGVSGADHAMVECGDGRFQGSTFLAGDLVQGNAEVKRWDDVCFSRFPNCKVSKNFLYIRCRFFNSWRGWILQVSV